MRDAFPIAVGRLVRTAARLRKPGGGSAVPGLVVNRLAPGLLGRTLNGFPEGLAIVSGSSGKSTTVKMLVELLRAHEVDLFTNPSTANIAQGLTSAIIEQSDWRGRVPGRMGVLEMDEGHGAVIAERLSPRVVVLTNVMVDQIDRFTDSSMVEAMLRKIALRATDTVVCNADDLALERIAAALPSSVAVRRFGASEEIVAGAPRGLGHAEQNPLRLSPGGGVRLLRLEGTGAVLDVDGAELTVRLPARGVHFGMDAAAALAAATAMLGDRFDAERAVQAFDRLAPVFGRGERLTIRGAEVEFVLVQNPASLQLNIDGLEADLDQVLVAVGSDVRDESYLWSADLSRIRRVAIVSGSKAYDAALHLAYDDIPIDRVEPDLGTAIDDFLALPAPARGVKTIVFTADAMRRTRRHLGLTSTEGGGE